MSTTTNKNPDKKCHELLSRLGLEYNVIHKKGQNHTCCVIYLNLSIWHVFALNKKLVIHMLPTGQRYALPVVTKWFHCAPKVVNK